MKYDLKENGFTILENFFSEKDLAGITQVIEDRRKQNQNKDQNAYPGISVSQYDLIQEGDSESLPQIAKLSNQIAACTGENLALYNSLYLELHASSKDSKPGFGWHQDLASFCVLQKDTVAYFSWFVLGNSLNSNEGTMEFVRRDRVSDLTKLDLREKSIQIISTAICAQRWGIDLRRFGKYVVVDALNNKILAFFDKSLEDVADTPTIEPGDLVICDRDIMHRTAPTSANTGKRTALTIRFVDKDAVYNGCLDDGIPFSFYEVYRSSELWQRLHKEGKGARIIPLEKVGRKKRSA